MAQVEETLSFEKIMEYMYNHENIYKYIIDIKAEESVSVDTPFKFITVMQNSIILFLAIRDKLGWEIWKEDMNGPFYEKSKSILHENPLLEEIHLFTIYQLKQLLRMSNGLLGYVGYERLPQLFCEKNDFPKTEGGIVILSILKALFKYRYETSEDFELIFGPEDEEEK